MQTVGKNRKFIKHHDLIVILKVFMTPYLNLFVIFCKKAHLLYFCVLKVSFKFPEQRPFFFFACERPRGRAVSTPDFGLRGRRFESRWRRYSSRT